MGWEQRGKGLYFYDKIRQGNKVFSLYFPGGSSFQEMGALLQQARREQREQARQKERREREELEASERTVKRIGRQVQAQLSAVLTANGYHYHKGEWRKQRVETATL